MILKCSLLHMIRKSYLLKPFPRALILMTQESLSLLPLLELKQDCVLFPVSPNMVKKVMTDLDSSITSGPVCTAVVVLKNCKPEL